MTEIADAEFYDPGVDEPRSLAVVHENQALALPAVSPADAKAAMTAYLQLCEAILTEDDYQSFRQWDPKLRKMVDKKFKKKSAVKKLQTFYALNVQILRETRHELGGDHYGFVVVARATTPSGKFAEAEGACTTMEDRFDLNQKDDESAQAFANRQKKALARAFHDVLSTAGTRARNRAVMECLGLGGGEVTAEEISRTPQDNKPPADQPRYTREEQIKIERTARLKELLAQAKKYGCECDNGDLVLDGPTLRRWAQTMTAGCDDWAVGTQPTLQHIEAMESAMKLIEEHFSEGLSF